MSLTKGGGGGGAGGGGFDGFLSLLGGMSGGSGGSGQTDNILKMLVGLAKSFFAMQVLNFSIMINFTSCHLRLSFVKISAWKELCHSGLGHCWCRLKQR